MESVSDNLVKAIKERVSAKNAANILADVLCLNVEAVYRRLRGQVPFTLDEAVKVCKTLNISLESFTGIKDGNKYTFHLDTFQSVDPLKEYCEMLTRITNSMEPLKNDPSTKLYKAHKTLPQEFLYNYNTLSKVYAYILYYQLYSYKPDVKKMSEVVFPEDMHIIQKKSISCVHDFDSIQILDRNIIIDYINTVRYFFELGMISDVEITEIKKELYQVVTDIEKCANTGLSRKGKSMNIYLSNISFDCSYNCMESNSFCVSSLEIYYVDFLSCEDKRIFEVHKSWIMSLLKFSVLISVVDELTRKNFFAQQRHFIDTML